MVSVQGALESAGGCSVPLTLVVLGGWFWEDDDDYGKDNAPNQGRMRLGRAREARMSLKSPSAD